MTRSSSPPILVTGAHRSGTTWVGKMLTASGEAAYISEPLNVWHRPGVLRVPVRHWYTYICKENDADVLPALRETLQFRYHFWTEVKSLRSLKDFLRMGRDCGRFTLGRLRRARPLLKDPFAVFSALWFARSLGCQVVITVRHPAAFASSLKRLGWTFDFDNLLQQPLLMRDWLEPFRLEMEAVRRKRHDVIGQSALLWRMIYYVVAQLRNSSSRFYILRHEDLSLDPVGGFRALYASLGLTFSERALRVVRRYSASSNPQEVSVKAKYAVRLNSRANLRNWKRRLNRDEVARIRRLTEDVAAHFYSDKDWL